MGATLSWPTGGCNAQIPLYLVVKGLAALGEASVLGGQELVLGPQVALGVGWVPGALWAWWAPEVRRKRNLLRG